VTALCHSNDLYLSTETTYVQKFPELQSTGILGLYVNSPCDYGANNWWIITENIFQLSFSYFSYYQSIH